MAPWSNCVVPLAVELGFFDIEGGHFGVGDFDTFFVGVPVKAAGDGQPLVGRGVADQCNDHQVTDQRLTSSVLHNE